MQKKIYKKGLIVFSGGQDSTTCLGWSLNRYKEVECISFFYGQKHSIELEKSQNICKKLNIKQTIINLDFLGDLINSALTSNGDVSKQHEDNDKLPASFVPNRNALFLTLSHAYAQKTKADHIITGTCQTDYSGYPDCRREFIDKLENSLNIGSDVDIKIITPLMLLTKAETFELAEKEQCLDLVLNYSHTCYNGSDLKNEWGFGCGECPACQLRKKGYYEFKQNR
jgi:7-cyano-7-deazaguanine synthase